MKKTTHTCLILLLAAAVCKAQPPQKQHIKVNLLSPLVRTFSGFYEHQVSGATSVQLGVSYTGATLDEVALRGWSLTPEFRYYAAQKGALQGFYVAPFMRWGHFEVDDKVSLGRLHSLGGGLLIGTQKIFASGISLDVFAGPSYSMGKLKLISGTSEPDVPGSIQGFGLRAGLSLGLAF